MLRFSKWKLFSTIGVILIGLALAIPSMTDEAGREKFMASLPGWVPHWIIPQRAIVLGLDLQGGSQVLLEVDSNDLIRGRSGLVAQLRDDVRRIIREERVPVDGGIQVLPRGVQVRFGESADQTRVMTKFRGLAQPVGGDVLGSGGPPSINITTMPDGAIQLVYTDEGINERIRRTIGQAIEVVRRRIDLGGTTEPNIQRQGADRILIQVPGLQDPESLKEQLGKTAKLEFRFIARPGDTDVDMLTSQESGQPTAVERRVIVGGEDLVDAQAGFDQRTNEPIVNFRFNVRGAQRFGQATTEGVGRQLAIVLDNEVISAPVVNTPITQGSGQISGRFTTEAATNLSILLKSGALPAKLSVVEERTVGPGLGKDSIDAGKIATIIAGIFVITFMFVTYGLFGFFANIALIVHIGLILGLMSVLEATLTLPGIAGIVLTIGTAVDSNVLIYERIREEFRDGRSVISSIEAGFHRAFATIIDANSTMAIAALILFFLGSGPVRGFAVVFLLGILTTVITAVTLTRMMIAAWYAWARPKSIPF